MDDPSSIPSGVPGLTQADAADLFAFAGTRGKTKYSEDELILDSGPLTSEHLELARQHVTSGATLGIQPSSLKAIRHTHHRLAQLLAMGVDETRAGLLCNYTPSRVSVLKGTPAFQELIAHYKGQVDEEWRDFVSVAADLSLDFLGELQRRLDEDPESFTPSALIEATKVLADRTGHAPVTKSVSVSVSADVGSRLEAARARIRAEEAARALTSDS